ncbi:Hypothetical protein AKI40_2743 [Enterobacter sp. FY-07]|nr:Hypothetical protein AKI40_2743 [Enterobacter sp. FY-07]
MSVALSREGANVSVYTGTIMTSFLSGCFKPGTDCAEGKVNNSMICRLKLSLGTVRINNQMLFFEISLIQKIK